MSQVIELSTLRCMICTKLVGAVRIRRNNSSTCSDECHKEFLRRIKALTAIKDCPTCHKPSTPAERAAFRRFRLAEKNLGYDVLYPRLWKAFLEADPTRTREQFFELMESPDSVTYSVKKDIQEIRVGFQEDHANIVNSLGGGVPSGTEDADAGTVQPEVQAAGDELDAADTADPV